MQAVRKDRGNAWVGWPLNPEFEWINDINVDLSGDMADEEWYEAMRESSVKIRS